MNDYFDVFISYSRSDESIVSRLCDEFNKKSIKYFIDKNDISDGSWRRQIASAIKNSKYFIIIYTKNTTYSENVHKEIILAEKYKIRILPFIFEGCSFGEEHEYSLEDKQRFYITNSNYISVIPDTLERISQKSLNNFNVVEVQSRRKIPLFLIVLVGVAIIASVGGILFLNGSATKSYYNSSTFQSLPVVNSTSNATQFVFVHNSSLSNNSNSQLSVDIHSNELIEIDKNSTIFSSKIQNITSDGIRNDNASIDYNNNQKEKKYNVNLDKIDPNFGNHIHSSANNNTSKDHDERFVEKEVESKNIHSQNITSTNKEILSHSDVNASSVPINKLFRLPN